MKDLVESFFVFLIVLLIIGGYFYYDYLKFQRCIEYSTSHPEMFGTSCKGFYK